MKTKHFILIVLWLLCYGKLFAADRFVSFKSGEGVTPFVSEQLHVALHVSDSENVGVRIAADNLRTDFERATGQAFVAPSAAEKHIVVATYGQSPGIERELKRVGVRAGDLQGKVEKFIIHVGRDTIHVVGSDRRGTIYGVYELCEQLGVSPWNWWADVPVVPHAEVYVRQGVFTDGEPAVRYRGIFINDEAPCFTSWTKNTYGTNYGDHRLYARVFELILRLRGNMLWPAMWSWAFYADDPLNGKTANDMGVIIGTSHHEPMARNHQEWARKRRTYGDWNYQTNQKVIDQFFREGIERAKNTEDLITIGMRGDGDEAMSENTDTRLMERIITNQRRIIKEVTGKSPEQTPQVWALYKEVLDYYEQGLRAPDDVIMLLCDDNWGNVRRLPNEKERQHPGGWGIYYHVDYVGAPRNSKWLCNTPIQNMWEQLTLTYDYGVDRLWILNVGDIKPMEYSISQFMDLAWNPHRYQADNLLDHTKEWCAQQFGANVADEAAEILNLALKYNGRCTAEMLDARTYDLPSGEWKQVVDEYKLLELRALNLFREGCDAAHADAFRQVILFPVQAMSNLYEMYYAQAMNRALYAERDAAANVWADRVEQCFKRDAELCRQYNEDISGGKWNGMMTQKHIGYTTWNDNFPRDIMPRVERISVSADAENVQSEGGMTFVAERGRVSIEAEHYYKIQQPATGKGAWTVIPDMGRTKGSLAVMPYIEPVDGASVSYRFVIPASEKPTSSNVSLTLMLKSNLAFANVDGHRYGIRVNGGEERIVNYNGNLNEKPENIYSVYYPTVARRVIVSSLNVPADVFTNAPADTYELVIRPLEPGLVIQKVVLMLDGSTPKAYLGYPESPQKR